MNYLFIGHGRVTSHFSHWLGSKNHKVSVWSRRSSAPLENLVEKSQVICLGTRDREVAGVIEAYQLKSKGKDLVHFSGAQVVPGSFGFHPLMTFGHELYPLNEYENIHFVGTEPEALFRQVFPNLKNPYHSLAPSELSQYHALCTMAGNFPQILWNQVAKCFSKELQLPPDALGIYLNKSLENYLRLGEKALTGPLSRSDQKTIIRHLDALQDHPLKDVYYAFLNLHQKTQALENHNESRGISPTQV